MVRLFVAVDFPEQVRSALAGICFGLPGARWVPEDQIHLTLRFIGEVHGDVCQEIGDELARIRTEGFELTLKGLGHFPPRGEPRVLWVGVEKSEGLFLLHQKVENALIRIGLEPEKRKYSPHVTLARLENAGLPKLTRFLSGNALFSLPPVQVDTFHLYSSVLSPKGAIHHIEASYPLSATNG